MIENYLVILEDSLKQKKTILEEIAGYNVMQEVLLKQENMSLEKFDEYVDKKDTLIQKIVSLDEGFDSLYEKVREQLISNKDSYKEQIARIQQLITEVTEKGVKIQTQEARNRDLLTAYFSKERTSLKRGRKSSKAALGYYQNLSKAAREDASTMDMKK